MRKTEFAIRFFGAWSVGIVFSTLILELVQLISPEFSGTRHLILLVDIDRLSLSLTPWVGISCVLAFVFFIVFHRMKLGLVSGERLKLSNVFDCPKKFFKNVKKGKYSMRWTFLIALLVCFLFVILRVINANIFIQAKFGSMISEFSRLGAEIASSIPTFASISTIAFTMVLVFMGFFAVAFWFYWISRAAGGKISYLALHALSIHLFLIPLSFLGASVLINLASYLAWGNVSIFNMKLFTAAGLIVFCFICGFGIEKIGGISLKKSFIAILPLLLLITLDVYLTYSSIYGQWQQAVSRFGWL